MENDINDQKSVHINFNFLVEYEIERILLVGSQTSQNSINFSFINKHQKQHGRMV